MSGANMLNQLISSYKNKASKLMSRAGKVDSDAKIKQVRRDRLYHYHRGKLDAYQEIIRDLVEKASGRDRNEFIDDVVKKHKI